MSWPVDLDEMCLQDCSRITTIAITFIVFCNNFIKIYYKNEIY